MESEHEEKELFKSENMKLVEECKLAKVHIQEMEQEVGEQVRELSASLELAISKERQEHQLIKLKLEEMEHLFDTEKARFEKEKESKQADNKQQEKVIADLTEQLKGAEKLLAKEKEYSTNEIQSLSKRLNSKTKSVKDLESQLEELADELNMTDDKYHRNREELHAASSKAYTLQQRLQQRELEIRRNVDEIFLLQSNEKKNKSTHQRVKFDLAASNKNLRQQRALNRDLLAHEKDLKAQVRNVDN